MLGWLAGIYLTLIGSVLLIAGMWVAMVQGSILWLVAGLALGASGVLLLRHNLER